MLNYHTSEHDMSTPLTAAQRLEPEPSETPPLRFLLQARADLRSEITREAHSVLLSDARSAAPLKAGRQEIRPTDARWLVTASSF